MSKQERLKISQDYLNEAKELISFGVEAHYIMNALYYSMFNAVLAILDISNFSGYTHDKIFALFDERLVKNKKFPEELFNSLKFAKTFRHKCDDDSSCELVPKPTLDEVQSLYPKAVDFLQAAKKLI
uniref:HEPN domain-containing protein n=1 Tax=Thermodesulfobium narugense TaxID=184064 RepID=A0A7C5KBA2_9BACT